MSANKLFGKLISPNSVLYAAIFLILSTIGYLGGRSIGMITISNEPHEQETMAQTETSIGNGQRNLLIITVDQLEFSDPFVESIWLLITYPEFPKLTLVPVYPAAKIESTSGRPSWIKLFSMNANQTPNKEFLEVLHEQFFWQDYLVIDKKSVSAVQNILKQYSEKSHSGEIQSSQTAHPIFNSDLNTNLEKQIQDWNSVCLELTGITDPSKIDELLLQISPFIRTNVNWDNFVQQWTFENHEDFHLGCEFPTLALNNP
jgi:hypothetical protein